MHSIKSLPFHIKPLEDDACVVITGHDLIGTKNQSCYNLDIDIRYSFDNKKYKKYKEPLKVKKNQKVFFKGSNNTLGDIDFNSHSQNVSFINFSCENVYSGNNVAYNVYGNITSLLDPDNYYDVPIPAACFVCFFMSQKIIDASKLYLPSSTIGRCAYESMFEHCSVMKYAPKDLPANKVPLKAYSRMFKDCIALKSVPNIHAVSFAKHAFQDMFDIHNNATLKIITTYRTPLHFPKGTTIFKRQKLDMTFNAWFYKLKHLKHMKTSSVKLLFDL